MYTLQNPYAQKIGSTYDSIDKALHAAFDYSSGRREKIYVMRGTAFIAEVLGY